MGELLATKVIPSRPISKCDGIDYAGRILITAGSVMSRATKRKHVLLEVLRDDFSLPTKNQQIVRVLKSRGNNLHEVEAADKSVFLASMPTKFRKNIWVKRGDFVLVEPIEEGCKVKAEMVRILTSEHIKQFTKDKVWPQEFTDCKKETFEVDDMFVNRNRPTVSDESTSDSDSSDDD